MRFPPLSEKQCPDWALIYFNRGHLHMLLGRNAEADKDFTKGKKRGSIT